MMYSAYKLNKQGDLHIGYTGGRYDSLVFPSLEEFSTVCGDPHSQSLFRVVNEAEVDVFLEFPCIFYDLADWQFDLWLLCLF